MRFVRQRLRDKKEFQFSCAKAVAFQGHLGRKLAALPLTRAVAEAGGACPHVRDEHVHVRVPRGVDVTQETVGDFQMSDVDRKYCFDYVLPPAIEVGLALLRARSLHKIELAMIDMDVADDFAVPQLAPRERKVDVLREEKRFPHLAIFPEDAEPVQAVGAAPEVDADIVYMTGVAGDLFQAVVHQVLHHKGQCNPPRQQDHCGHGGHDDNSSWPRTDMLKEMRASD